jgi:hypothetical protein
MCLAVVLLSPSLPASVQYVLAAAVGTALAFVTDHLARRSAVEQSVRAEPAPAKQSWPLMLLLSNLGPVHFYACQYVGLRHAQADAQLLAHARFAAYAYSLLLLPMMVLISRRLVAGTVQVHLAIVLTSIALSAWSLLTLNGSLPSFYLPALASVIISYSARLWLASIARPGSATPHP